MRSSLLALVLGCAAMAASEARAQFIVSGPDGSIGIRNPSGSYTFVYPQRLNPLANVAQPGTPQMTPNGNVWVGYDGQVHGNLVDPMTGDIHLRSRRPSGPGGVRSGHR